MKITVFSGNQPRHLSLVRDISQIADEVFFVSEVQTIFPGQVCDRFQKSDLLRAYFSNVIAAEKKLFGETDFLPSKVKTLSIKLGDLSRLNKAQLGKALSSDIFIVFGSSYIKGWLIDYLISQKAINIHMGLSPYYRGSACNFWALYDYKPGYVGATIHYLSKGLDSGDMLFHCVPYLMDGDSAFDFTMRSVKVAHGGLIASVKNEALYSLKPTKQEESNIIRYARSQEFNDQVAKDFLNRGEFLNSSDFVYPELLEPIFG